MPCLQVLLDHTLLEWEAVVAAQAVFLPQGSCLIWQQDGLSHD